MLNEVLFYGGMAMAVIALILALIFFITYKVKSAKLNRQLDKEYGESQKNEKYDLVQREKNVLLKQQFATYES